MTNETKTTTIYAKIQKVRSELVELNLKKSGKNSFTSANYYELGDFTPSLNKLMNDNGIVTRFTLEDKKAVLVVFNVENPEEKVTFYIPTADAGLKSGTPIQNLGAQITYLRRYLLMIAFEIAEGDAVDAQKPEEVKELDQIHVDKINAAMTLAELTKVSKELQKELGNDFRKGLVAEYTRRKKEIENSVPVTYK